MALKRQHDTQSAFSMSSMTDVVFLLLIFFMVTSTFVVSVGTGSESATKQPNHTAEAFEPHLHRQLAACVGH